MGQDLAHFVTPVPWHWTAALSLPIRLDKNGRPSRAAFSYVTGRKA
jgi:hypothetical protein